jgi:hypothetical protein
VVDLDQEKFFDRVNYDKLMAAVARRVADKRMLKLIRALLTTGVMERRCAVTSASSSSERTLPIAVANQSLAMLADRNLQAFHFNVVAFGSRVTSPSRGVLESNAFVEFQRPMAAL